MARRVFLVHARMSVANFDPADEEDIVREGGLGMGGASDRAGIVMLKEDMPIRGSDILETKMQSRMTMRF